MAETDFLEAWPAPAGASDATDGTAQLAAEKLWALLRRRAARYAMGDHSSLPQALMEELLASTVFTLEAGGCSGPEIAAADLEEAFQLGQARIAERTARAKRLWQAAYSCAPAVYSRAYRDTLKSIGGFFERYDQAFFAHSIPCEIDYQLMRPLPERLQGVCYVEAYCKRIIAENALMRRFDAERTKRLLAVYCRDYREQVINLCEPVAVNALGRALLGADAGELTVSDAQQAELWRLLAPLPEQAARERLSNAARRLLSNADIREEAAQSDLLWLSGELYPRIAAALPQKNLGGIFLAF